MYAVVFRTADRSGKGRLCGALAAGNWSGKEPLPNPVIGKRYKISESNSPLRIVETSPVTQVLSSLGNEVEFKTKNADYRIVIAEAKPGSVLYGLGDLPLEV